MINWIKNWTNQVILVVIIAVILDLIVPKSRNKKYINMILGVYILFTIISPIILKINDKSINNVINLNEYFENEEEISNKKFSNQNKKIIEDTYKKSIKEDLDKRIRDKGYKVKKTQIDINLDYEEKEYGTIRKIYIWLSKENNNNNIKINSIQISNEEKQSKITQREINELKEYIASIYNIKNENIVIN